VSIARTIFSRSRCRLLATLLGLCALAPVRGGDAAPSAEYQLNALKAVMLFNFAQFTQWPATAFESPTAPFVIGILGDDPFQGALEEAVAGETMDGRPIQVRRFGRIEDARGSHILFIDDSVRSNLERFLAAVRSRPILTVSDIPGFARRGGTIAFYLDGAKLRFEINPAEAQRSGLQLRSGLLKLARIVPAGASIN
jgi:hypothetical protein